jgi:heme A synthase
MAQLSKRSAPLALGLCVAVLAVVAPFAAARRSGYRTYLRVLLLFYCLAATLPVSVVRGALSDYPSAADEELACLAFGAH